MGCVAQGGGGAAFTPCTRIHLQLAVATAAPCIVCTGYHQHSQFDAWLGSQRHCNSVCLHQTSLDNMFVFHQNSARGKLDQWHGHGISLNQQASLVAGDSQLVAQPVLAGCIWAGRYFCKSAGLRREVSPCAASVSNPEARAGGCCS